MLQFACRNVEAMVHQPVEGGKEYASIMSPPLRTSRLTAGVYLEW
jgi:hypothetical protein